MKQHYFFNSLRKAIVQFLDIFNNIEIARYEDDGTITDYIKVPIRLGHKDKLYDWISNRKNDIYMPIIGVSIDGLEYQSERQGNINEGFNVIKEAESLNIPTPTPYNMNFTLNILTKQMVDSDQILEQILPFFNPHIYQKVYIEELDFAYDMRVLLDSVDFESDTELSEEEYRMVTWTMSFKALVYLFKPTSDLEVVKKVITNTYIGNERDTSNTVSPSASDNQAILSTIAIGDVDEDRNKLIEYERWDNVT